MVKEKTIDYISLPWNFEAFRRFLAFDIVQQAAATLCLYDGQPVFNDTILMQEFSDTLSLRTGLEWLPRRQASEGVLFNTEGDVFRNKARVFTSLYLLNPESLKSNVFEVTEFGKGLGLGFIDEEHFYKEVCARYEYPHPAYDDNWAAWRSAGISLRPLAFILKILLHIYEIDSKGAVSIAELGTHAYSRPFYSDSKEIAETIVFSRKQSEAVKRMRSDKVDRKIGDILGFLCMAKLCFYKEDRVAINLLDIHHEEKTAFWHKRQQQDKLGELKSFLESLGD